MLIFTLNKTIDTLMHLEPMTSFNVNYCGPVYYVSDWNASILLYLHINFFLYVLFFHVLFEYIFKRKKSVFTISTQLPMFGILDLREKRESSLGAGAELSPENSLDSVFSIFIYSSMAMKLLAPYRH